LALAWRCDAGDGQFESVDPSDKLAQPPTTVALTWVNQDSVMATFIPVNFSNHLRILTGFH
jgi:hypothetical protein